jgi:hypothetical protein
MEQEDLIVIKATLKQLRKKVLEDEDIKNLFYKHFPDLDFEENLDETLKDLEEYAIESDYDILMLSLEGIKIFFDSLFEDEEDTVDNSDEKYGKA